MINKSQKLERSQRPQSRFNNTKYSVTTYFHTRYFFKTQVQMNTAGLSASIIQPLQKINLFHSITINVWCNN